MTGILPSKQAFAKYGQFNTMYTSGQRTVTLGGGGRTGLSPTSLSLTWATPAAAATITIPDPGGADTFTLNAATQTLTNKTLTAPTFGGVTTIAAGTAAAPSLTFTGDTDTGIYRVAANDFGVAVAGLIGFDVLGVASAVNNLKVTNSATGDPVLMSAIGTDTNIGMTFTAKGAGVYVLSTPSAPASVGGATGTNAGAVVTSVGGVGGATSIVTTGAGGVGGGYTLTGGAGGTAALAATAGTGGAGGALTFTTGAGAASAVTGAGTGTGGAGGLLTLRGGVGGATSVSTGGNIGGAGGGISLIAGAGGNATATAGTDTGGAGGVVTITPGAGGTGDANKAGAPGYVNITTGITRRSVQTIDMADAAVVLTLVPGTPVGTLMTSDILYVDANSSGTENLDLPPEADLTGIILVIVNTGGETINIRDDAGGAVLTLETANTALVTSNGTTLRGFVGIP